MNHSIGSRDSLLGTASYQRNSTDAANVFGFVDATARRRLDASTTWSHRFNQFLTLRIGYQFLRQTNESTPHFANRVNVSGDAGIDGNDQESGQLGPAGARVLERHRGLGTGQYSRQDSQIHGFSIRSAVAYARRA